MTQTGDPGTPIGEADSDPPDGILRLNRRRAGSRFQLSLQNGNGR